jgi:AraC family transcriptional regulator
MQERPIKGTIDWQPYNVVLDVPKDATGISFGILLTGSGRVWLNSTKFEVVGVDVPTTGSMKRSAAPVNLDFNDN